MIDVDGVSFFLGGDGLNSSLNLDLFVSATLFFRASNGGCASSEVCGETSSVAAKFP